jgi:hypothetical protein
MRSLTRAIFIAVLLWLEFILYTKTQELRSVENMDGTKVVLLFLGIVFVAIIIGTLAATIVVPAVGEAIGSFFYNPDQPAEKGPHAEALAKIAQGDYEGAAHAYKEVLDKNPEDMHALSEIIHLLCDKMGDHDAAEQFLEDALQQEWPPEQGAFLASRLVDVYWNHKHDAVRARYLLTQIIETMPDTKYAANAVHRLHEIDRVLAEEEAGIRLHGTNPGSQEQSEV